MESVHLGFWLAQMNGLKYYAADIGNVYITTNTNGKLYIIAGKEFGPEYEGKRILVEKLIYGTWTGGSSFQESLSAKLQKNQVQTFFSSS